MKLDPFEVDITSEDIAHLNKRESLKYNLTSEDTQISHSVHGVIKYDYIDLGITDYHFKQPFEQNEIQMYFERVRLLTTTSLNDLSSQAQKLHLRRSSLIGNLKNAVSKIYPEMLRSNPIIYHIALHGEEHKDTGDRSKGTRCPRLYFMLGTNGHIYMLFFDPYHELNPITKT